MFGALEIPLPIQIIGRINLIFDYFHAIYHHEIIVIVECIDASCNVQSIAIDSLGWFAVDDDAPVLVISPFNDMLVFAKELNAALLLFKSISLTSNRPLHKNSNIW